MKLDKEQSPFLLGLEPEGYIAPKIITEKTPQPPEKKEETETKESQAIRELIKSARHITDEFSKIIHKTKGFSNPERHVIRGSVNSWANYVERQLRNPSSPNKSQIALNLFKSQIAVLEKYESTQCKDQDIIPREDLVTAVQTLRVMADLIMDRYKHSKFGVSKEFSHATTILESSEAITGTSSTTPVSDIAKARENRLKHSDKENLPDPGPQDAEGYSETITIGTNMLCNTLRTSRNTRQSKPRQR